METTNIQQELEKLKRLLHDLTPGGSEFYNDPEYCAKWIRENREENHYALAGQIKKLKQELETGANQYAKAVADNGVLLEALKVAHKSIIGNDMFLSQPEWEQIEAAIKQVTQ